MKYYCVNLGVIIIINALLFIYMYIIINALLFIYMYIASDNNL